MKQLEKELELDYYVTSYEHLLSHIFTILSTTVVTVCKVYGESSGILENSKIFESMPHVAVRMNSAYSMVSVSNHLVEAIDIGCNGFIVSQDALFDFMDVYISTHDEATYRNPEKYLVILLDHGDGNDSKILQNLRNHPALQEMTNLLVLQPSDQLDSVDILTHRYVGSDEYSSEFYLLDRYDVANRSFQYGNSLFPDKTSNLLGRTVRVATFEITPHMNLIKEIEPSVPVIRVGNTFYELGGGDGFIVREFCRLRNCSVELVIDQVHMWGEIYENKTGVGILGNIAERRADFGVAGMSGWYHWFNFLAFSMPVQRGTVTCLAPKPELLPRWKIIVLAFSTSVYLTIFATFVIVIVLYFLVEHLSPPESKRNSAAWSILNVLAIFLLQATNIRKRNLPEVCLSMAVILFALNMGSIYSGRNASLRTIPLFEPSIDTAYDLAESGISWMQTHQVWVDLLRMSENPSIQKLVSNFIALPADHLRQIADQGGSAFALARLPTGYLMLGEWFTTENIHNYQLMREDLYYVIEFAMATKTWPLMERLNQFVLISVQGLLFDVPQYRSVFKHIDFYVQMAALHSHVRIANEPKTLDMTDVSGGFILLGTGLLFSMVVFALELILARKAKINCCNYNKNRVCRKVHRVPGKKNLCAKPNLKHKPRPNLRKAIQLLEKPTFDPRLGGPSSVRLTEQMRQSFSEMAEQIRTFLAANKKS